MSREIAKKLNDCLASTTLDWSKPERRGVVDGLYTANAPSFQFFFGISPNREFLAYKFIPESMDADRGQDFTTGIDGLFVQRGVLLVMTGAVSPTTRIKHGGYFGNDCTISENVLREYPLLNELLLPVYGSSNDGRILGNLGVKARDAFGTHQKKVIASINDDKNGIERAIELVEDDSLI